MVRHIFLTGQPGVGKSTLCQRVLQHGFDGVEAQGFYTSEVRDPGGQRAGFDVITLGGPRGPLARADGRASGPSVGKYVVDLKSFERLALPVLAVSPSTRLLLVDEVGKMELLSRAFFPAVRAALDSPGVVVFGTIPTPGRTGRVIPEVAEVAGRPDVEVVQVTHANRDALVAEIHARLAALLRSGGQALKPLPPPQQLQAPRGEQQRQQRQQRQGGA